MVPVFYVLVDCSVLPRVYFLVDLFSIIGLVSVSSIFCNDNGFSLFYFYLLCFNSHLFCIVFLLLTVHHTSGATRVPCFPAQIFGGYSKVHCLYGFFNFSLDGLYFGFLSPVLIHYHWIYCLDNVTIFLLCNLLLFNYGGVIQPTTCCLHFLFFWRG